MKIHPLLLIILLSLIPLRAKAQPNNPYPADENDEATYYSSFMERPKYLDPATAYSSDEYVFIAQIYEPVVQYHYLRRPYELVPLTAAELPSCIYYDKAGNVLRTDAPASQVARAEWTIRIKPGIRYQNHPCFAQHDDGAYRYHSVSQEDMRGFRDLFDFADTGTRELTAADYVYQIKRLADGRNRCPIFAPVVSEFILGMTELTQAVEQHLNQERQRREREAKSRGSVFFNREDDERANPIIIDYADIPCPGVELIDNSSYRIVLKKKYPQFIYWLAMPFFAPMPWEAVAFYSQGPMVERNIILNWYPVGTGAYRLAQYEPNYRVVLVANENFRGEQYPSTGEPDDASHGLLANAGRPLPLIRKAVYSKETESTPRWNKFLQGYYDSSSISSDNFSQVMDFTRGAGNLSERMHKLGINLVRSVDTTVFYIGFNMDDPVVGGVDETKCKLRQAISIAIDREQYIHIFMNGRGIAGQGPVPPGIFGYRDGKDGINPFVYVWDDTAAQPVRHPIERARKLLAEAGYPDGISVKDRKPLAVFYDAVKRSGNATYKDWLKKQMAKLGVSLEIRETDYNRFREKMSTGSYQMFSWGWNADYPDPENFLFLLYGPNSRTRFKGENTVNYANPEFDRLYGRMSVMANGPKRQEIIDRMLALVRHDAPWEFGFYPESYILYHDWLKNSKPNKMANNTLQYIDVDLDKRRAFRAERNKPRLGIVLFAALGLTVLVLPGIIWAVRRETRN